MHIPSGFCSPTVCAAGAALALGALAIARTAGRDHRPALAPAGIAALAGGVFAAQMLDMAVPGGTSVHLVGGVLLGVLAGPWLGLVGMAAVLAVQALLLADGGLDAFGLNLLLMGGVGVLGGWALHRRLAGAAAGRLASAGAAGIAAAVAVLVMAALGAAALALSGTAPLAQALPALLASHLPAALLEAAATAVAVAALHRPAGVAERPAGWPLAGAVLACAAAPFASRLPDGLESAAAQLGFAGLATAWPAPLAGAAGISAAVAGALVVAVLAFLATRLPRRQSAAA